MPGDLARRYRALPIARDDGRITVVMADPGDQDARNAVTEALTAHHAGLHGGVSSVTIVQGDPSAIDAWLTELWPVDEARPKQEVWLREPLYGAKEHVVTFAQNIAELLGATLARFHPVADSLPQALEASADALVILPCVDTKLRTRLLQTGEGRGPAVLIGCQTRWPLRKLLVALTPPSYADNTDDWSRLQKELARHHGLSEVTAGLPVKGLSKLIDLGKERGYVTYDDINRMVPSDDVLPEDLKNAFTVLSENDIEIIEGFADDAGDSEDGGDAFFGEEADWGVDDSDVPDVKTKAEEDEPIVPVVAKPRSQERDYGSDSTDPVRMYLQEMGSVPLLSREEEVTIAKEIESGLHEVRDCIYGIPLGYRYVIALADRLKSGEIEPRDIFADESEEEKSSVERDEKKIREFVHDVSVLKRLAKA